MGRGILVPESTLEGPSAGLRGSSPPLFPEKRDTVLDTKVAKFSCPLRPARTRPDSALAATNDPVKARQVETSNGSQERFAGEETHVCFDSPQSVDAVHHVHAVLVGVFPRSKERGSIEACFGNVLRPTCREALRLSTGRTAVNLRSSAFSCGLPFWTFERVRPPRAPDAFPPPTAAARSPPARPPPSGGTGHGATPGRSRAWDGWS